ncbi:hypothetical protein BF49_3614 [Bradyrhizobium sp.]|uniref:spike base protein, RCAP_Rcc01079 family n=1 Tax=Bradyrhizobium sp. TaxID=376 RepID=UPI0007C1AEEB|nr:hypothetical protein [Bradyrhizobium sp.]CUT12534.1 hypothetical protein BF49_3614 [Bradyrhizobium sp.]
MSNGVENAVMALASAQDIATIDVSGTDQVLATACRGLMVTVAGDAAVTMADGSSGVLPALQPGTLYPFAVKMFKNASTTATGIKALL